MLEMLGRRCRVGTCCQPAFHCDSGCPGDDMPRCKKHAGATKQCSQRCGDSHCRDCIKRCALCLRNVCPTCASRYGTCPECSKGPSQPNCDHCGKGLHAVMSGGVHTGDACRTCDTTNRKPATSAVAGLDRQLLVNYATAIQHAPAGKPFHMTLSDHFSTSLLYTWIKEHRLTFLGSYVNKTTRVLHVTVQRDILNCE